MKTSRKLKATGLHLVFWCISFAALLQIFTYQPPPAKVDYIYTLLFHLSLATGVYLNLLVLVPRLLKKEKWIAYAGLFIVVLGLTVVLNLLTFEILSDWLFPGYFFISYWKIYELALFGFAYLVLSTLIHSFADWIKMMTARNRMLELEKENRNRQLQALKEQINPHFLFNSLNNLYGMLQKRPADSSRYLLKLSSLLRYSLYDTDAEKIPVLQEVQFYENFIALNKIRYDSMRVNLQKNITNPEFNIPPLLALPLIENSFKHAAVQQDGQSDINLTIGADSGYFTLKIENYYNPNDRQKYTWGANFGIGISNLRQRLEMMYPETHRLEISAENHIFSVFLEIRE